MQRICTASGQPFEITPEDIEFYKKLAPKFGGKVFDIPPPTLCPDERVRRRMAWRNERNLYFRTCDATGKQIISIYAPESDFPVYDSIYWWSDHFDAKDYGRDFDFSRGFFEQFADLLAVVPMPCRTVIEPTMINSDFCNEAGEVKDCYLCFEVGSSEKCCYCRGITACYECLDCLNCDKCESCYMAVQSQNCAFCSYVSDCKNCSDCFLCSDCIGCKHCFGSSNLRNKSYVFMDKQLSKAEYQEKVAEYFSQNPNSSSLKTFLQPEERIVRTTHQVNTENCSGDYLSNCRNCHVCFFCGDAEDCRYCDGILPSTPNKDCMDVTTYGVGAEQCYESQCVGGNPGLTFRAFFSNACTPVSELYYCHFCVLGTENCFGCVGMKHGKYSILNKQYSKDEYEILVQKIIEHMQITGEWGEFFPMGLSKFSYNETIAQEYFLLTKEEVLAKGWKWRDETNEIPQVEKIIPANLLPDSITDIPDDILNWAIECDETGKPFIIQKIELEFYRKMNLPIPRLHPDVRHKKRMQKRNPRKLWQRNCDNCGKSIQTSYTPGRPEKVYCEECYQKAVY